MDWFQRHCQCLAAPHRILHLGAGSCSDLAVYEAFSSSLIVLVEPQADLAADLRRATSDRPNIKVAQAAVASRSGEAMLKLCSLPKFSSLQPPSGLKLLFPGQMQTGAVPVDTLSMKDLIVAYDIVSGGDNWLVLDAPGAESLVIEALANDDLSGCFSHLFLRAGREALYEGTESVDQLLVELNVLGYEEFGTIDARDADLPAFHLKLNPLADEVSKLRNDLESARAALVTAATNAEEQLAKVQALARDEAVELRSEIAARDEALTRFADERKALVMARDEQAKLVREGHAALEFANKEQRKQMDALVQTNARQKMLEEELIRVEAQVDLIKDLALGERSL